MPHWPLQGRLPDFQCSYVELEHKFVGHRMASKQWKRLSLRPRVLESSSLKCHRVPSVVDRGQKFVGHRIGGKQRDPTGPFKTDFRTSNVR